MEESLDQPVAVGIRLADRRDGTAVAEVYRPFVEHTPVSFETAAPDAASMASRIEATVRSFPWLVCEIEGHLAGYAYASEHRSRRAYRWSVDTSVYVGREFRGRAIGRGLYASLLRILAAQGFFNAFAGITLPNAASVALHEHFRFQHIGTYRRVGYKAGAWHDVGWWQLRIREDGAAPTEPLVIDVVKGQPDWEDLVGCGLSEIRRRRPTDSL